MIMACTYCLVKVFMKHEKFMDRMEDLIVRCKYATSTHGEGGGGSYT